MGSNPARDRNSPFLVIEMESLSTALSHDEWMESLLEYKQEIQPRLTWISTKSWSTNEKFIEDFMLS